MKYCQAGHEQPQPLAGSARRGAEVTDRDSGLASPSQGDPRDLEVRSPGPLRDMGGV